MGSKVGEGRGAQSLWHMRSRAPYTRLGRELTISWGSPLCLEGSVNGYLPPTLAFALREPAHSLQEGRLASPCSPKASLLWPP